MDKLQEKINDVIGDFQNEMETNVVKGNKSAGARARKLSLELAKLLKEYRKVSVPK